MFARSGVSCFCVPYAVISHTKQGVDTREKEEHAMPTTTATRANTTIDMKRLNQLMCEAAEGVGDGFHPYISVDLTYHTIALAYKGDVYSIEFTEMGEHTIARVYRLDINVHTALLKDDMDASFMFSMLCNQLYHG